MVDRRSPAAALLPLALAGAVAWPALAVAAEAGIEAFIVVLALLAGIGSPPLVASMRRAWQQLLGPGDPRLTQAYSFEASAQVALFVLGPLLAGLGIAVIGPGATLAVPGSSCSPAASPSRHARQPFPLGGASRTADARASTRSAYRRYGRWCSLSCSPTHPSGVVDVAVIAFANERGQPSLAGPLLAAFAASAALGGVILGARATPVAPSRRLTALILASALAVALLALANTLLALGALLILAGAPAAAIWATASIAIDHAAPPDASAEAYSWFSTANAVGIVLGSAVAGVLIEASDVRVSFLAGSAALVAAALTVITRRRTLQTTPSADLAT